jgi:hypothetical protein
MAIGPRSPVVELDSMTHQHLRQPVSRSHQIQAQCLPGANEIAQRLFFGARDADRVQLAGEQQPDEMLSVAAIVLDFLAGRARDLRRRRDYTFDPAPRELPRERVPSRARLLGGPDRSRQSGAQGRRTGVLAVEHEHPKLARVGVKDCRDDLGRVHVQTDQGSSLRHGWFPPMRL